MHIPILHWLWTYKKNFILSDLVAGITIGIMQVSQGKYVCACVRACVAVCVCACVCVHVCVGVCTVQVCMLVLVQVCSMFTLLLSTLPGMCSAPTVQPGNTLALLHLCECGLHATLLH